MENAIIYAVDEGVAKITFNRPRVYNSFNRGMALDFQEALDKAEHDDAVRCIVITGNGKAFSAGQDLVEVTSDDGPELRKIVGEHYNPIIKRIRKIEKPIIAAVNGVAAGAGANIALACDIVVSVKSATFIQAFSKIGLIPDSGGTWTLPRLIGLQRATALAMLGDKVPAEEAERIGMIYRAVEDDSFEEQIDTMANKLAGMPTRGLGLTKKALNASFDNSLQEQLDLEEELQNQAGSTHDYNEGVAAFLEKRKPEFKGK